MKQSISRPKSVLDLSELVRSLCEESGLDPEEQQAALRITRELIDLEMDLVRKKG